MLDIFFMLHRKPVVVTVDGGIRCCRHLCRPWKTRGLDYPADWNWCTCSKTESSVLGGSSGFVGYMGASSWRFTARIFGTEVHLANGEKLHTDDVIFVTGWDAVNHNFPILMQRDWDFRLAVKGIPRSLRRSVIDYLEYQAEAKAIEFSPRLASSPATYKIPKLTHTYSFPPPQLHITARIIC